MGTIIRNQNHQVEYTHLIFSLLDSIWIGSACRISPDVLRSLFCKWYERVLGGVGGGEGREGGGGVVGSWSAFHRADD